MADSGLGLRKGAIFNDRYRVSGLIKWGGMGAIYEVAHCITGRPFALKVLLPHVVSGADFLERFRLEATATARLQGDHVVGMVDAGVDGATGLPFLVMDLLDGEDLAARLRRDGPMSGHSVLGLYEQLRLVLDKTHAAGIVHRDLKPENLFLTRRDDGSLCLKVLDFGIAKVVDASTFPRTTCGYGTPLYMPPEQIRGEGTIGPAADLYALGQIAFTLMTGEAYWEPEARTATTSYAFFLSVLGGTRDPASVRARRRGITLPQEFDRWFCRATALAPAERFETASELVEEFAEVLRPAPSRAGVHDESRGEVALGDSGARRSDVSAEGRVRRSASNAGAGPRLTGSREGPRSRYRGLPIIALSFLLGTVVAVLSTRGLPPGSAQANRSATLSGDSAQRSPAPPNETGNRCPIESATDAPAAPDDEPGPPPPWHFALPDRDVTPLRVATAATRQEVRSARAAKPLPRPGEYAVAIDTGPRADPTDIR